MKKVIENIVIYILFVIRPALLVKIIREYAEGNKKMEEMLKKSSELAREISNTLTNTSNELILMNKMGFANMAEIKNACITPDS